MRGGREGLKKERKRENGGTKEKIKRRKEEEKQRGKNVGDLFIQNFLHGK